MPQISRPNRLHAPLVAIVLALVSCVPASAASARTPTHVSTSAIAPWLWPVAGPQTVTEPFRAPAHAYGAGHRGADLASAVASPVHAPADGVVAFRGTVVDRPLLTIAHPGGYVTTFEPLESALAVGDVVSAGDEIGILSAGGHATLGTLHLGVRLHGVYIDPMLLFGRAERAVLLPCCDPL